MRSEKSYLLTPTGTPSFTAIAHMESILNKRRNYRKNIPGGILGILMTVASVFKNANSFFFQ